MAISSSSSSSIFSVISLPSLLSSKTRRSSGSPLNLRTPSLILRLEPSPSSFPSSLSVKPISSKTYINPTRVSSTQQQKYVYPDPIPEFAESETQKFRSELRKKLSRSRDEFGDEFDMVLSICVEIFNKFLHKEYGGPGTLLVEPFTDMLVALKENKLPGAPIAARAALLWAQNYLDEDWEIWNAKPPE